MSMKSLEKSSTLFYHCLNNDYGSQLIFISCVVQPVKIGRLFDLVLICTIEAFDGSSAPAGGCLEILMML